MKMNRPLAYLCLILATCAAPMRGFASTAIIVSVSEQKLAVIENGQRVAEFPVSTSKFGLGDRPRSYATPLGLLEVAQKVGAGAPEGAVFKGQHFTGEILRPNSPGRDPIVTRILHLRGLQAGNSRAFDRGIYIHGTPEERKIGRPASYGCIRMRSHDVVRVFDAAPIGTRIEIVQTTISRALTQLAFSQHDARGHELAAN
jgi:lipoprotein-anchoring transpeptidase ErfK/SrfK